MGKRTTKKDKRVDFDASKVENEAEEEVEDVVDEMEEDEVESDEKAEDVVPVPDHNFEVEATRRKHDTEEMYRVLSGALSFNDDGELVVYRVGDIIQRPISEIPVNFRDLVERVHTSDEYKEG